MTNYPEDIRQYDDDPRSPFHISDDDRIESIAADIINGNHECTVEDCVTEVIYEDAEMLERYKQGLQDIALTPSAGHELHRVIDEAVDIMARRVWERQK